MLIYIYAIFIVFDIIAMAIAGWEQYNVIQITTIILALQPAKKLADMMLLKEF